MLQKSPLYAYLPACFLYPTPNAGTSRAFEEYDMPGMKRENAIYTGGGAKAAWFKDSEGNILAVIQSI
jgi:hypothetical protein